MAKALWILFAFLVFVVVIVVLLLLVYQLSFNATPICIANINITMPDYPMPAL